MHQTLTQNIIGQIKQLIKPVTPVIAGYLFGSYAAGKTHAGSDIDLGFLCFNKRGIDVLSLATSIERMIKLQKIDVVVCDLTDKPLLMMEIIKGQVIYQINVDDRALLERRILKLYEDYQTLLNIKKIYLDKSFSEGVYAVK